MRFRELMSACGNTLLQLFCPVQDHSHVGINGRPSPGPAGASITPYKAAVRQHVPRPVLRGQFGSPSLSPGTVREH